MNRHASQKAALDVPSSRSTLLQAASNVTVVLILLIASALLGFATGLLFRILALLPLSLLLAVLSAISLQASGFGFVRGVLTTIGCLVFSQIAYLAAGIVMLRGTESLTKEVDGDPDRGGEHDISDQDE